MPSQKRYDSYDIQESIEEEDVYSVDLDDDGNPYINPDLHNIGMDHEKNKWIENAYEDIVYLYRHILNYRDNEADSHILERITFNRFLIFIAQNSIQIS